LLAGAAVLAGLTGSIAATDREPADPEDVAEAARAVAEAQAVLREREAELRELLGEDGDYFMWNGDGVHAFGFSNVLPVAPTAPTAPTAPEVPHVRVLPNFDGFGQSFDFTWDWDGEGLDEEAMEALREELREQFAHTQDEFERTLEQLNLAELGQADIERQLRRQYQERFSAEEAQRAAEAARERAMAEVERARERVEAARESGEFGFVIPSAPNTRLEFLAPGRPRSANDAEMIARIEALEEMLGELRDELRTREAAPRPEPSPEPAPEP
ncbi:MAG: hypothetical protein PVI23_14790, partial [Maricaulaceae bacterium]